MGTKEQIISESLRLFNDRGEENVGVREIARALRISPGNLSYHFPRKEDIIAYHLDQLDHELQILIEAYLQEEEDLFRFPELIKHCMERQYEYRGLYHLVYGKQSGSTGLEDRRTDPMKKLMERVETSIEKLGRQAQLQLGDEDGSFIAGVINFHLGFWLSGIRLDATLEERDELIRRYLLVITKLLLLFASPNGRINLLRFKAGLLRHTA